MDLTSSHLLLLPTTTSTLVFLNQSEVWKLLTSSSRISIVPVLAFLPASGTVPITSSRPVPAFDTTDTPTFYLLLPVRTRPLSSTCIITERVLSRASPTAIHETRSPFSHRAHQRAVFARCAAYHQSPSAQLRPFEPQVTLHMTEELVALPAPSDTISACRRTKSALPHTSPTSPAYTCAPLLLSSRPIIDQKTDLPHRCAAQ
ncbi:hypothetical protein GGR56DRAFT_205717 [Xylariaceae sp. FL0804]|nr:hypothetical protein GGR56DRAFT_205717 [Xylariaceae sp. FL0804]